LIALTLTLALGVLALDFLLPAGITVWVPLIALVLFSLWAPGRRIRSELA
jgi:hypothetical protein